MFAFRGIEPAAIQCLTNRRLVRQRVHSLEQHRQHDDGAGWFPGFDLDKDGVAFPVDAFNRGAQGLEVRPHPLDDLGDRRATGFVGEWVVREVAERGSGSQQAPALLVIPAGVAKRRHGGLSTGVAAHCFQECEGAQRDRCENLSARDSKDTVGAR